MEGEDCNNCSDPTSIPIAMNVTMERYLEIMRGPKQLALAIAIPFTIFNVMIFVTGIVGNICVCLVIVRNASMHTATNYYLFSLAISDLTLLIFGLPNDVTIYWHQYPWTLGISFCKLRALVSESASNVSVLTIVAFSMERYLAICHPLHLYAYAMSGFQRAVRIIALLWLVAFVSAAPFAAFTTVHYLDYPEGSGHWLKESAFCAMLTQPTHWPISEISTIVFFLVPMLVILLLYILMGFKIRKRSLRPVCSVHRDSRHSRSRKAIIRMLAAVVLAFFLCWAPFHAQRLIYIYGKESKHFLIINEWMFYITGLLYYVSATVNPILYNLMSKRYRIAFRQTLCGWKPQRRHGQTNHSRFGSDSRSRSRSRSHSRFSQEHSSFRETFRSPRRTNGGDANNLNVSIQHIRYSQLHWHQTQQQINLVLNADDTDTRKFKCFLTAKSQNKQQTHANETTI